MSVGVGDEAPDFTLPGTGGRDYSLAEFAGHPVVLVFYPGDDSPVCTKQLTSYNDEMSKFTDLDARVIGISPQHVASHDEFARKLKRFLPHPKAHPEPDPVKKEEVLKEPE